MFNCGMFEYWHRNQFYKIKIKISSKNKIDQSYSSSNKIDNQIKPLANVQLQSAYYFFLIGVFISILSIFIEISSFFITVMKPLNNGHYN